MQIPFKIIKPIFSLCLISFILSRNLFFKTTLTRNLNLKKSIKNKYNYQFSKLPYKLNIKQLNLFSNHRSNLPKKTVSWKPVQKKTKLPLKMLELSLLIQVESDCSEKFKVIKED